MIIGRGRVLFLFLSFLFCPFSQVVFDCLFRVQVAKLGLQSESGRQAQLGSLKVICIIFRVYNLVFSVIVREKVKWVIVCCILEEWN
jgi:hypothetical protein